MTHDEMIVINRVAEKIAQMNIRPAGKESWSYAAHLLGHVKKVQAELCARWPKHKDDVMAGNVLMMQKVASMSPVVEAAQLFVRCIDEDVEEMPAEARLIGDTHTYNLIHDYQPEQENKQP